MWRNRLDTVSGACQDHWTGRTQDVVLQPWRTKGSLLHSDSNKICIKPAYELEIPTITRSAGNCRDTNLQTKIATSPLPSQSSNVRNHRYGCVRKSDSIMLAGFGSLLTKILFSYRSTEVYGVLIVMKTPTERSRSWGLRSGLWPWIGDVREVWMYLHSLLGSMHWGAPQGDSIVLTLMGN